MKINKDKILGYISNPNNKKQVIIGSCLTGLLLLGIVSSCTSKAPVVEKETITQPKYGITLINEQHKVDVKKAYLLEIATVYKFIENRQVACLRTKQDPSNESLQKVCMDAKEALAGAFLYHAQFTEELSNDEPWLFEDMEVIEKVYNINQTIRGIQQ